MCKLLIHIFFISFIVMVVPARSQDAPVMETGIDSVSSSLSQINERQSSFSPIKELPLVTEKTLPGEKVDELKNDDAYWYANREVEKQEENIRPLKRSFLDEDWFKNLLWMIIIVSFVGVVVWYVASSNVRLFRKSGKKITGDENETIIEDIFAINFEKEISNAVAAKDFRLAVRLWYLLTLKELSGRNIIEYRQEKTNSDYLNALSGGRYYKDFFRLTRNFEYTWYGQFNLSEGGYEFLQKDFGSFKNSLGK